MRGILVKLMFLCLSVVYLCMCVNMRLFCFQLKRLRVAVSFGGGRSQLLEEGSLPRDLLESPQSCVVDFTTGASQTLLSPSATEWANSVKSIVERFTLPLFCRVLIICLC